MTSSLRILWWPCWAAVSWAAAASASGSRPAWSLWAAAVLPACALAVAVMLARRAADALGGLPSGYALVAAAAALLSAAVAFAASAGTSSERAGQAGYMAVAVALLVLALLPAHALARAAHARVAGRRRS